MIEGAIVEETTMATATLDKPTNGAKPIEIPELRITRFQMKIVGRTPLITNRFGETAIAAIEKTQTKAPRGAHDAKDIEAEFQEGLYLLPDGGFGFPATGVKRAIADAAIRMTEHKGTIVRAAFNIEADLLPIVGSDPVMRTDHVGGPGKVRYRPMFWPWSMTVPVGLVESVISLGEFLNIARMAGFGIGIGNWRPEKNGTFGTFDLES